MAETKSTPNEAWTPCRGDVVRLDLSGAAGYEKRGTRPAVVVQNNKLGRMIGTAVVAPATTRGGGSEAETGRAHEVYLEDGGGGLRPGTVVECQQLRTVSVGERLVEVLGWLEGEEMGRVDDALEAALGLR